MRYGVRKKVRIRRNEIVEEVKCFRYWGIGHFIKEYQRKIERKFCIQNVVLGESSHGGIGE